MKKEKKPLYKRIWFWLLILFVGLPITVGVIVTIGAIVTTSDESPEEVVEKIETEKEKIEKEEALGDEEYEKKNYQKALDQYAKAIEAGTKNGITWYRYAYSKKQTGQFDLAAYEKAYQLLLSSDPSNKYLGYARNVLMENSKKLDYRKAMFEEYEHGTRIVFEGEVSQVIKDDEFLLYTKKIEFFGYFDDLVYVVFDDPPRALEKDIIRIMALYQGALEYKTVLRSKKKVPRFTSGYCQMVSEAE